MLPTWTLVIFLNGQPFVYPKEIPTLDECSEMSRQALGLLVPNSNDNQTNTYCGRTDLSAYKPGG